MSIKTRNNKATKKKEYKCRYYFKTTDGVRHDSETGWFPTEKEAKEAAAKLKETKENAEAIDNAHRRERLLVNVFEDYVNSLLKESEISDKTTAKNYYFTAHAILKHYIPKEIGQTRIKDITSSLFYNWLSGINENERIGGKYIRSIKLSIDNFNEYLRKKNYYTTLEEYIVFSEALKKVKLKGIRVNNLEDAGLRNWYNIEQFHKMVCYYKNDLGRFKNFYWYTFFYVLFFSGMRVEEIIALQWNDVDFETGYLTIDDSIPQIELKEKVKERFKANKKRTKNNDSVRTIPILDIYFNLLKDYQESYGYQFALKQSDLSNCFIFPNLVHNKPFEYQTHDNIGNALKRAVKAQELPKTDPQMFRHSCAYFLIDKPPKGLGYSVTQVYRYFGHHDDSMLREIYGRLNNEQKTEALTVDLASIATHTRKTDEQQAREDEVKKLIERVKGENTELEQSRKKRIFAQIDYIRNNTNKSVYYYRQSDIAIIEKYKSSNPDCHLQFLVDTLK